MNPKLSDLARHSFNGASNPLALINALPAAIEGTFRSD
jgi:hypothetical protein